VESIFGKSPIVLEAGAHNGTDTVRLSARFRSGTIHAFEPVPRLYAHLKAKADRLPNVYCYNLALGANNGDVTLYLSDGASDASSSLLPPKEHLTFHPKVKFESQISVPCTTLDEWATAHNVHRIDFAWLDLQGLEPEMLRASPKILGTMRAIYTEINLIELYQGGILYNEFRDWLKSQGFIVRVEDMCWEDAGNVFFTR
jgi:FkbM family methyltransferase